MILNRIGIVLTTLFAISLALAEENVQRTDKAKGAKAIPAPVRVIKLGAPAEFPRERDRLPRSYTGVDTIRFAKMFKARIESVKKGEFETSEEFTKRIANTDVLLAPIKTSVLYAFRIEDIDVDYDADRQAYRFGGYSCNETSSTGTSKDWVTCKVAPIIRKQETYVGSNIYGASRRVEGKEGLDFALAFPKDSAVLSALFTLERGYGNRYEFSDKVALPLETARTMRNRKVAVLFVGQVTHAKIINGRGTFVKPTIDMPYGVDIEEFAVPFDLKRIVYYVVQTGEILEQKAF